MYHLFGFRETLNMTDSAALFMPDRLPILRVLAKPESCPVPEGH